MLKDAPLIPSRWPHRMAVVLCCATFPLIWVGGLVTTYDAGMAVPDWPTTYGYNLFRYPWQTWLFGPFDLLIEHGHRLLGAAVGILAIGFVVSVWFSDRRRWLRVAAVIALALVAAQGILGGARVRLDERGLAMIHGCVGLATFAYLAAMTVVTSRFWSEAVGRRDAASARLRRLCVLTSVWIFAQVDVGAMLRHMPVTASHQVFRVAVLFHLLLAGAVVVQGLLIARLVFGQFRSESPLVRPASLLLVLIGCQLAVGAGTWVLKYGWPSGMAELSFTATHTIEANGMLQSLVTTAHVALGALILAQSVALSVRAARFFRPAVAGVARVPCAALDSGHGSGLTCNSTGMRWTT